MTNIESALNWGIPNNTAGLIFDFDGTLVDSMEAHLQSWQLAFQQAGHPFPRDFFYRHAGVCLPDVVKLFNETFNTELDPGKIVQAKDEAHLQHLGQTRLIAPVMAVVHAYIGKLPMAIATGNAKNLTEPLIRRLNLGRYFEAVIFGDDVEHPKPHPQTFLKAAAAIGVAPDQCVVFEDGDPGLAGAKAAGMTPIDIRPWLNNNP